MKSISMSLGQFIQQMLGGWGFQKPYEVVSIGRMLSQVFKDEDLDTTVTVVFKKGSYGYGPTFHFTYGWEIEGIELPQVTSVKAKPGQLEAVFGYQSHNLPEIRPIPGGFRCGYVW